MISDHFFAEPMGMWIEVEATPEQIRSVRFMPRCNHEKTIKLPVSFDLLRYFQGEPVDFSSYLVDLGCHTSFQQEILAAARSIPWGTTVTYSQLASMAGRPGAARAAGNALSRNNVPVIIPCHRVVSIQGAGGFSCGVDLKLRLLRLESVDI